MHALARAAAEGADKTGAHVRLRKVAELAPVEVISARPAWGQHLRDTTHVAGDDPPGHVALEAARYQARRAVDTAASLKAGGSL